MSAAIGRKTRSHLTAAVCHVTIRLNIEVDVELREVRDDAMPLYDLVIKGGTVIDGLQTPRYKADVTSVVIGNCGFGFAPCKRGVSHPHTADVTRSDRALRHLRRRIPWWPQDGVPWSRATRGHRCARCLPGVGTTSSLGRRR
ncbi:hypothetical protein FAGKG844_610018 [Frankia sp. AgKG'84/4]